MSGLCAAARRNSAHEVAIRACIVTPFFYMNESSMTPVTTASQIAKPLFASTSGKNLRILQFSDTHLYEEDSGALLGLNTRRSLNACIQLAKQHHWPADLILVTGDLVHDYSIRGYEYFYNTFNTLNVPIWVIPGNHDSRELIQTYLRGGNFIEPRHQVFAHWQIIMLDSSVPACEYGTLHADQLEHLQRCLQQQPDLHALIALHHPPVAIGSPWLDRIGLRNSDALFQILTQHSQAKALIWGHVHQAFEQQSDGIGLYATPSTCVQFKPRSNDFEVDYRMPGYRWILLQEDGRMETGIQRMPGSLQDIVDPKKND